MRRATATKGLCPDTLDISIHALREEGDCTPWITTNIGSAFLSTPSVRRATDSPSYQELREKFLSTPSVRRATPIIMGIIGLIKDFYPRPP